MIHVEKLTKNFGPVCAVNNVSFQVEKNEIVGLLGNNGAGKTTIMRMLDHIPAGHQRHRPRGRLRRHDAVDGGAPAGSATCPRASRSTPKCASRNTSTTAPSSRASIAATGRSASPTAWSAAGSSEVQRRLLGTLSKGYRQRVGLADAMINDPPILILDEPTDGLDPGQKAETLGMLRELGKNHTIMLSSHLLSEVETMVQRVIIMRRGIVGLATKLSELETDPVIVLEVRGPRRAGEGRAARRPRAWQQVACEALGDGVAAYEVRTHQFKDLREDLAAARGQERLCACGGSTCAAADCRIAGTRSTTWTRAARRPGSFQRSSREMERARRQQDVTLLFTVSRSFFRGRARNGKQDNDAPLPSGRRGQKTHEHHRGSRKRYRCPVISRRKKSACPTPERRRPASQRRRWAVADSR